LTKDDPDVAGFTGNSWKIYEFGLFLGILAGIAGENRLTGFLERFSNRCSPFETVQGGFFLRKKPLGSSGFGV
jgi:hypothetical protein